MLIGNNFVANVLDFKRLMSSPVPQLLYLEPAMALLGCSVFLHHHHHHLHHLLYLLPVETFYANSFTVDF